MKSSVKRARQAENKVKALTRQLENRNRMAAGLKQEAELQKAKALATLKLAAAILEEMGTKSIEIPEEAFLKAKPEKILIQKDKLFFRIMISEEKSYFFR